MEGGEGDLRRAEPELTPSERELWEAVKAFVDGQVAVGASRDQAYRRVSDLLRGASNLTASRRRATFKVVLEDDNGESDD